MKRLFALVIVLVSFSAAYSYDIQITGTIPLEDRITAIAAQTDSNLLAVAGESGVLYLIDGETGNTIRTTSLDAISAGVAFDSTRNQIIAASRSGILHFIDIRTGEITYTISVKPPITAIASDRNGSLLYIGTDSDLSILDLESGRIIKKVELPASVSGIAIDDTLGIVLVLLERAGLSGLDAYTLQPAFELSGLNCCLSGVSANPSTHIAIATNPIDNSITVISSEQGLTLRSIPFLSLPSAVAINQATNVAYIGHAGGIAVVRLENPVPMITSLVPRSARSGDSGFRLSVEGEKFVRDSQAEFDRREAATYFRTNETIQADIPAEYLTRPGDVPVTVSNPPPGGGVSNTYTFRVYNPAPVLESITPEAGSVNSSFTLRASGRNFFNGSVINFSGENLRTKFISSILLEAEISPALIQKAGHYPVVVINPNPGGFTSNAKQLVISEKSENRDLSAETSDTVKVSKAKETGSLRGRVVNTNHLPLGGVEIKIKNLKTETDADGYFLLDNVPAGKNLLLIDGSTEKKKDGKYPTIPLNVNITANIVNDMPFQVYFHKQKDRNFKRINPAEDTILSDPEVPGFELRIPKGVNITGWDGKPNLKVSVRTVPTDRLPVKPLPDNAFVRTVYMFYFDKIGGGTPDQPIPMKAPNDLGLLPGEKAILWYYDESPKEGEAPNDWAIAGTGTVTPDGMYIVADPGVGIPKFCCGASAWGGTGDGASGGGDGGGCKAGCCGSGGSSGGGAGGGGGGGWGDGPDSPKVKGTDGDPVDLATGYFIHSHTDLHIPGIIPVSISRYFRSGDNNIGAFGRSTYFEYDWWLGAYGADGRINNSNPTMYRLIKPGNYQHRFSPQADGTYINSTDPDMKGAVVTKHADSSRTLKMRDGWSYKFDASGDMTEISDRNGNKLTLNRRSAYEGGYLREIVMPDGRKIIFNQTLSGIFRTDTIVDPTGRRIIYIYEDDPLSNFPRLRKVVYPDLTEVEYRYDSAGRMTEFINERGIREVLNESDTNNRVIRQTHSDGGVYTFDYTVAGGFVTETRMTAPNGSVTTWRFNSDKYITEKTTPDGTTTYTRETGTNKILSVTDPLGRVMSYTYDVKGNVTSITDNAGNTSTFTYDATFSRVSSSTNALGHTSTMTYDTKGNMLTSTAPDGKTTAFTYNTIGRPITVTDNLGHSSTMEYDASGNLIKVTDPLSNISRMTYDTLSRMIAMTDPKGKVTEYTYDAGGRIQTVTDPLGNVTTYVYTLDGKLATVTDAKNQAIRYEYDIRGRLKKMTDQLGKVETYTYDTSDRLVSVTDRKGQTSTYQYDLMNRMTRATYHDGSLAAYTYDTGSRLLSINDSISGTISYTYTGSGCGSGCSPVHGNRIASETTPLGSISYTYDAIGRRTGMTVAGQPSVYYTYDVNGRLTGIDSLINGLPAHFGIGYDGLGRRASLALPNGVTTNYSYDSGSRLLTMEHKNPLNQVLDSLSYTYDPNGNRTSMTRPTVALPLPNAVTGTSYNDANQMLSFAPQTGSAKNITYDDNGNMIAVTNGCGTTTYSWDMRNRLVGISGFNPLCSPLSAAFSYDALGRRISKTINSVTTQYLYDGLDIVQEKQNGVVTANYIRTLNIDEPLARIKADGSVRYYQQDALGSIIALTDETGAIRTQYSYDPFGNTTVTGETSDNPFQYTGRENDGTGLYYYRARYYSPELQRFVSEDPIGLAGGINKYIYVINRPTMTVDPKGLSGCGPGSGWGDRLVPDEPYGIDFTPCCNEHDKCYGCKGNSKMYCDFNFCFCVFYKNLRMGGTSPVPSLWYCYMVILFGGPSYGNTQK